MTAIILLTDQLLPGFQTGHQFLDDHSLEDRLDEFSPLSQDDVRALIMRSSTETMITLFRLHSDFLLNEAINSGTDPSIAAIVKKSMVNLFRSV